MQNPYAMHSFLTLPTSKITHTNSRRPSNFYRSLPLLATAILVPEAAGVEATAELKSLLSDPNNYLVFFAATNLSSVDAGYELMQSKFPQSDTVLDYNTAQDIAAIFAEVYPMKQPAVDFASGVTNELPLDIRSSIGEGAINATLGAIKGGVFSVNPANGRLITTLKGLNKLNEYLGRAVSFIQNLTVVRGFLDQYADALKAEKYQMNMLCNNPIGLVYQENTDSRTGWRFTVNGNASSKVGLNSCG